MPEPVAPKEWHEDVNNKALDEGYDGDELDNPDSEAVGEDVMVDEWGEESESGFVTQFVKDGEE